MNTSVRLARDERGNSNEQRGRIQPGARFTDEEHDNGKATR